MLFRSVNRLDTLARMRVRERFEERFTATRMARDYLRIYRELAAARKASRQVVRLPERQLAPATPASRIPLS